MASYAAIAAVSRTLQTLLRDRMEIETTVTLLPMDKVGASTCLNLYLFQVQENAALANQELPTPIYGSLPGKSRLALDLWYLMTAFAQEENENGELSSQNLLGDGMRTLHDYSIITEQLLRRRPIPGGPPPQNQPILDEKLLNESEHLRISLEKYSLEEMNKLWSTFPNANYRRSVVYHVSVVQIESKLPLKLMQRVGEPASRDDLETGPQLTVTTLRAPQITEVRIARHKGAGVFTESRLPVARAGDKLILLGSQLFDDENRRIFLNDVDVSREVTADPHSSERIEFLLKEELKLPPGANTVRVSLGPPINSAPKANLLFSSNTAFFSLVPRVDEVTVNAQEMEVTGANLWVENRKSLAIIGHQVAELKEGAVQSSKKVVFLLPTLDPGNYRVHVRLFDGTESIDNVEITV
jgi:hypothetical protein